MLRPSLLLPTLALALLLSVPAQAQQLATGVAADLTLTLQVDNLSGPTGAEYLPDGRMMIIQQSGEVLLWNGSGAAVAAGTIPTGGAGGERGLLGLAVDPMFATTNRIYFYHSVGNSQSISWAVLDPGNNTVGGTTEIVNGLSSNANHDGGGLRFGPDGYLYAGVGDTGCNCGCVPGDTSNANFFGTCLAVPHGKIIRVDRDGNVPASNPLVGVAGVRNCGNAQGCGFEPDLLSNTAPDTRIYGWGFRNPWRFDFDEQTGWLWVGNVGEVTFEEVDLIKGPGEHHGWPFREGNLGQALTVCNQSTPVLNGAECTEPIFWYPHSEAPASGNASITGGTFSNHCSWPAAYYGRYWFGDYNKNRVWTLTPNATRDAQDGSNRTTIVTGAQGPVHFLKGLDGSISFVGINAGQIWRIAPANPVSCDSDAGVPMLDASTPDANPPADTGVANDGGPAADTGTPPDDSGTPGVDSGVMPGGDGGGGGNGDGGGGGNGDGGGGGGGDTGEEESGCGCTTTSSTRAAGIGGSFALLVLGLLSRRRRR